MKSRVVAEPITSALEMDAIRARHAYCYTQNRPAIVAWVKRQMHKRARRRDAREIEACLQELVNDAQAMGFYG